MSACQVRSRLKWVKSHLSLCWVVEMLTIPRSFLYFPPVCIAGQSRQGGQESRSICLLKLTSSELGYIFYWQTVASNKRSSTPGRSANVLNCSGKFHRLFYAYSRAFNTVGQGKELRTPYFKSVLDARAGTWGVPLPLFPYLPSGTNCYYLCSSPSHIVKVSHQSITHYLAEKNQMGIHCSLFPDIRYPACFPLDIGTLVLWCLGSLVETLFVFQTCTPSFFPCYKGDA